MYLRLEPHLRTPPDTYIPSDRLSRDAHSDTYIPLRYLKPLKPTDYIVTDVGYISPGRCLACVSFTHAHADPTYTDRAHR